VKGNYIVTSTMNRSHAEYTATVTMTGAAVQTYSGHDLLTGMRLRIDKSGGSVTAEAGTTNFMVKALEIVNGTFYAPSGTLYITQLYDDDKVFYIESAGTCNHNSGTLRFDSITDDNSWYGINVPSGTEVNNLTFIGCSHQYSGPGNYWSENFTIVTLGN